MAVNQNARRTILLLAVDVCCITSLFCLNPGFLSNRPDITCHAAPQRFGPGFISMTVTDPSLHASPPPANFDLSSYGITVKDIRRNLAPATLYAEAIREDDKCDISDTGALIAYSGDKTGRSPKDKRI